MTDFASYMVNLASVAAGVETVITDAKAIYDVVAKQVTIAEQAFAGVSGAGATKKAMVMAAISVAVANLGQAWSAVQNLISAFIDAAINLYNSAMSVTKPAPQS